MIFTLKGTQVDVSDAMREYAEKKIKNLEKYYNRITAIDVEMGRNTRHHHTGNVYFAEANMSIPGNKKMLRAEHACDDLYQAIDKVHDELKRELLRYKDIRADKRKRAARVVK